MNKYQISFIQYGNTPTKDSPHRTPRHAPLPGSSADGPVMLGPSAEDPGRGAWRGVGWGGIPYGYIPILDIGYWIYVHTYSERNSASPSPPPSPSLTYVRYCVPTFVYCFLFRSSLFVFCFVSLRSLP